jgi:hypothetical protein
MTDWPDEATPIREEIFTAIRAYTAATVAEAEQATRAIIRIVRNNVPCGIAWPPKGYDHNQPGGFDGPTGAD